MVEKTYNLPTSYPWGGKFDIQHSMTWRKDDFLNIRHNDFRDLTANMMSEVCKYTKIELKLAPLSGEELQGRTSSNSNDARLDIRTRGFCKQG